MKRNYLIVLLFLSCLNSISQNKSNDDKKWIIKLDAFQIVDAFSFPTLSISIERKLNNWSSIGAEVGYQVYKVPSYVDTIFVHQDGFKANVEGRIYFLKLLNKKKEYRHQPFLGLQAFYRQNQKSNSVTYRHISDPDDQRIYYNDDFGVEKRVKGINLMLGYQFVTGRWLILEPFLGIGVMDRKLKNIGLQYDENKHISDRNDGMPIMVGFDIADKDSETEINFRMGFKLGYRF